MTIECANKRNYSPWGDQFAHSYQQAVNQKGRVISYDSDFVTYLWSHTFDASCTVRRPFILFVVKIGPGDPEIILFKGLLK